jgi:tRNA(Arg) A34 adenosine deaminase TadA
MAESGHGRWEAPMRRALQLARRGEGFVEPNPQVGAVILSPDGTIVGEGWHTGFGGPHAEIAALGMAGDAARGGTLVVTLEPCPMCAGAVVNARLDRLVFGASDPRAGAAGSILDLVRDPRLNHRAEVQGGVCAEAAAALLRAFFAARRRPAP